MTVKGDFDVTLFLPIIYGALFLVFCISFVASFFAVEESHAEEGRAALGNVSRTGPIQSDSLLESVSDIRRYGSVSLRG